MTASSQRPSHIQRLLEQLLIAWLPGHLHEDAAQHAPVEIVAARSLADAGLLTLDRGVQIELSDGSAYLLTIHPYQHLGPYPDLSWRHGAPVVPLHRPSRRPTRDRGQP